MLPSYPSIYNLGHRALADLLNGLVLVEEKIDGSQFSFGVGTDGELRCRSKGVELNLTAPTPMFNKAVETAKRLAPLLNPGWVYRGEFLAKPGHNTLIYDRVPKDFIILFDINTGLETYLSPQEKKDEGERLGLEVVEAFFIGKVETVEQFRQLLDTTSVLGGQKIEGVVIKPLNYDLYGQDKKVLLGKFVSEHFKEVHQGSWREKNPTNKDIITQLIERYKTPARWDKALQHLREAGEIQDAPQDIGKMMKEVPVDIKKEEEEAIKTALFRHAWPHIARGVVAGIPEWYKERLLEKQFQGAAA